MELKFIQFCLGPGLVTTKDAGDAVTLLQSLAGSTFDSSQLVLTACMGHQNVNVTCVDPPHLFIHTIGKRSPKACNER